MTLVFAPIYAEKSDYSGINATDGTGEFSAGNVGGWNSPNMEITNVVECWLEITKPDPDTLMPSTDPAMTITKNVYYGDDEYLPNITGAIQAILAEDDLDYTDGKLLPGIYYMNMYGTDDSATEFSNEQYFMSLGAVKCCIRKMFNNVDLRSCGREETTAAQNLADKGTSYIWGAENAFATGLYSQAADNIARANEICANCGCTC